MKTFRDTAGREWAITVDVNAIKRVLKAPIEHLGEPVKVNLLELVDPDGDLLKKVVAYPPLVCDIAYALCKPQCDEKNVSDEEFGRAMGGDVLERVLDLLIEETVDFFPQGRRAVLKKVLSEEPGVRREGEDADRDPAGGGGTGCGDRRDAGTGTQTAPRDRRRDTPDRVVLALLGTCRHHRRRRRPKNPRRASRDGQGPPTGRVGTDRAGIGRYWPTPTVTQKTPEPFEPWEFNPFAEEEPPKAKKPEIKMSVDCLKGLCDRSAASEDCRTTSH